MKKLLDNFPELAIEYHAENDIAVQDIAAGSNFQVRWICILGHEWIATPKNRTTFGQKCPYCAGKRATSYTSLKNKYPDLIEEWDWDKNKISPDEILPGTNKKYYWKCKLEHSWIMTPNSRVYQNQGCPECRKVTISRDHNSTRKTISLVEKNPELLDEWDWKFNKVDPYNLPYGSGQKFGWTCKNEHFWLASAKSRTGSSLTGCPFCKRPLSKGETKISEYLTTNMFNFKNQYCHSSCRNSRLLRFDFAIFKEDKTFLVEYQGQQHYHVVGFFGGINSLNCNIIRDQKKREFCNDSSIPLLEIPYWKFDQIPELLKEFLG